MASVPASTTPPVSFANDIMPVFNQFKAQMMWRLDLTDYDQVKANAQAIWGMIRDDQGPPQMPPPTFPPLSHQQIMNFKSWMDTGYAP